MKELHEPIVNGDVYSSSVNQQIYVTMFNQQLESCYQLKRHVQ